MYISVKLLNGYHESLLYHVPQEFEQKLVIGSLIRVPLRNRQETAVIETIFEQKPQTSFAIKSIVSFEHVPDDRKAMKELYRVLKKDGYALIMVPIYRDQATTYEDPTITDPEQRLIHFDQKDHVRRYGLDIEKRLQSVGFDVTYYPLTRLSESIRKKYGFVGYDNKVKKDASRGADIYLCTKK